MAAPAFGGERVEDIDLVVRAPSGEILAQDVGLDARLEVTFCAGYSGAYAVELRLYSGSGEWSLAVAEASTATAARAEGWAVSMAPLLGSAWIGAEHRLPVTLHAGECYRYAAVAVPGVVDLWLTRPDQGNIA